MLERIKTFFECFLVRRAKPQGRPSEAEVIGAFSLGCSKYGLGLSNEVMAEFVEELHRVHDKDLTTILQWEIANSIKDIFLSIKPISAPQIKRKYLDTLEVAAQMVKEMRSHSWKKVIVVAHSLHIWRMVKVLKKLGVEPIIPARLETIPFDPGSEQWWTRNRFLWTIKEIPVRLLSLAKGWI